MVYFHFGETIGLPGGSEASSRGNFVASKVNKGRTYNLLDIKEAVEIKPQDYSKAINTKEFQFVQKPRDGTQNWEVGGAKLPREATLPKAPSDRVAPKQKKGKGLRSKYDLA